jgi:hypothetical protein
MDDRELLESAARAIGCEMDEDEDPTRMVRLYILDEKDGHPLNVKSWNPLIDDGDAFRLAVTLNFQVLIGQGPDGDVTWVRAPEELDIEGPSERHGADACSATRRAIVRAAAEIGKDGG